MYQVLLAWRYLPKRRMAYIAVAAVAICVFTVAVVMTVMTGLVSDFKEKNHGWVGDCVLSTDSLVGLGRGSEVLSMLEEAEFIACVSPVAKGYGLMGYGGSGYAEPVEMVGIVPRRHCEVTNFGRLVHYHRIDCNDVFKPPYAPDMPGCVLGIDKVLIRDSYGRYVHSPTIARYSFSLTCIPLTPAGALARAGLDVVNTKTFYYSDDCHSGLAHVDGSYVYVDFEEARGLLGMDGACDRISAFHIKFAAGIENEEGCRGVKELWEGFSDRRAGNPCAGLWKEARVESWKEYRREVIAPVEKEQTMMTACFAMLGVITSFIVFVIFYMLAASKTKDIGVLKSLGARKRGIMELFLGFAALVGFLGAVAGSAAAVLFVGRINDMETWLYEHYGFRIWDRAVYAIDEIPDAISFDLLLAVLCAAVAACMLGAAVPAWRAASVQPVDSLRVTEL